MPRWRPGGRARRCPRWSPAGRSGPPHWGERLHCATGSEKVGAMTRTVLLLALALLIPAGEARASFTQEPGSPYVVGADPSDVGAGDFTGDKRPDVAIFSGTGSTVTMLVRSVL